MKTCSKCKIPKDEEEFYKNKKTKDGLKCWCKSCCNEDSKKREPFYNATRRKYTADHPEEAKARKKKYYNENTKKVLDCNRLWRQTFNGKLLSYKREAKKRGIEWLLSDEEFKDFWGKDCYYCGSKILGVGIDRVDNSKGYIIDNTVPCCCQCNIIKMDYTYEEFIDKIRNIYKNLKLWETSEK